MCDTAADVTVVLIARATGMSFWDGGHRLQSSRPAEDYLAFASALPAGVLRHHGLGLGTILPRT